MAELDDYCRLCHKLLPQGWLRAECPACAGIRIQERVRLIRRREGIRFAHAIEEKLAPIAARFETQNEHWVHGGDEGLSYCFECCKKEVERFLAEDPDGDYCVDGGWGTEGDSQAFCETCGKALSNSFTTYACEQELDHFEVYGFDSTSPSDCHSFDKIMGAEGCESSKLADRIIALAKKIAAQLPEPSAEAA